MPSDRLRVEPNRLAHSRSSLPRRAGRRTVSAAGSDPLLSLSEGRPERHDEAFLTHRDADRAAHPVVERVFHPRRCSPSVPGRSAYTSAGAPASSPGVPRLEPRAVGERRVRLGKLPVAESAFGPRRRSGTQRPTRVAARRPQSGRERTRSVPRSSRSRATTKPPTATRIPATVAMTVMVRRCRSALSSAMRFATSERSASRRSFTLWMSALVTRFELSRFPCSFARTSGCFSVKPFAVRVLTNRWVSNATTTSLAES